MCDAWGLDVAKVVESGGAPETKLIMLTFFLAAQARVEEKKVPKGESKEGQRCNLSPLSCKGVHCSENKNF